MRIWENIWCGRLFFLFGFISYVFVGRYLDSVFLSSHYDPLLELIPVVNVYFFTTLGLALLYIYAFFSLLSIFNSRKEAEFFILFGSFLILRSILCFAAHFGPPEGYFAVGDSILIKMGLLFRNDFFFSGHTSAPFLFFLFFNGRIKKAVFLAGTILMGIGVLLLHHHYVIDVIAAIPIVYAIYCLNKRVLFKNSKS